MDMKKSKQFGIWWSKMIRNKFYPPETSALESVIKDIISKYSVKGKKVLDVGAGEGRFARFALELGAKVEACDNDPKLVKICNKSFITKLCNAEELPWVDNSFDLVMSNMVLMCIEDIESAIEELARVTKKNGKCLITLLHPCFESWIGDNPQPFLNSSEYLKIEERSWHFIFPNGKKREINYYHRPISTYLNLICEFFIPNKTHEFGLSNKNNGTGIGDYCQVEYFVIELERRL